MKLFYYFANLALAAANAPKTIEIASDVHMPVVNLGAGGGGFSASNFTLWFELGGRGVNTNWMNVDGADQQHLVGQAIKQSHVPRSEIFVATTVPCCPAPAWGPQMDHVCVGKSPADAAGDIAFDIKALDLEYVDLLLLFQPCASFDHTLEVYRAMESAFEQKKVRALGVANFNSSAIDMLVKKAKVKPALNQCQFSIGSHHAEEMGGSDSTLEYSRKNGIAFQAWSPLGGSSGVDVMHLPEVKAVAQAHNKSAAQVALRWITQQGGLVVTASSKASHDLGDLDLFDWDITDEEMKQLSNLQPTSVVV